MDLHQRQIELEREYSNESIIASQKQVLDAFIQGRATDVGTGRILLAKAFEACLEPYAEMLAEKQRGVGGKYLTLLRLIAVDVAVMVGLRTIINACAAHEPVSMQTIFTSMGKALESEAMLNAMGTVSETYTNRTLQYLEGAGTKSITHRYRTFLAGAKALGIAWEPWSTAERIGVAKKVCTLIYDVTGLFRWARLDEVSTYHIRPSAELEKHFDDVLASAKAVVRHPPMLIKPLDWTGQFDGGYLTDWCRIHAPMCGLRFINRKQREWVIEGLSAEPAQAVRDAMNKTQSVAYRVNKEVLRIFREAVAMRVGILGLPSSAPAPKPDFPFQEGWLKEEASDAELDQFKLWKNQMANWYTLETKRIGRKVGVLSNIQELVKYENEAELYFPTFIDWRGRMYFRSNLNPQSSDAVKGCLEFAEGKPLGERGLFWLKVHVANCCGYDKHDPEIKAKWTEDNWELIRDFINNPLDVDAPEPDTAFTLLQAGLALQEALLLPNPEVYVCHVPVAMDATCSGLQHLSALTRDTVGATYTNLIDSGEDQKSDIYMHVAGKAEEVKGEYIKDPVIVRFWAATKISRSMAKRPVMTFVYGSTLLSTIDNIVLDMADAGMDVIRDATGDVVYSLNALAIGIGKALRYSVREAVPKCADMMDYLQMIIRKHKDHCMQWVTPVGVPVVNWAEGKIIKELYMRCMGVKVVTFQHGDGKYNTRVAANGIVPNFVHSMDSAHLCMTINDCDAQILPIHDSFGTHPSTVDALHKSLRSTFINLYKNFSIEDFLLANNVNIEDYPTPEQGDLDLDVIEDSRFMFC